MQLSLLFRPIEASVIPSPEAEPYIFHPLRVMIEFRDPVDQMAAVLHDVVEDTDREIRDLVDRGFPKDVVTAIDCLTHRSNEIVRRLHRAPLGERCCTTREDHRPSTQPSEQPSSARFKPNHRTNRSV